jgi:hypothetical protein
MKTPISTTSQNQTSEIIQQVGPSPSVPININISYGNVDSSSVKEDKNTEVKNQNIKPNKKKVDNNKNNNQGNVNCSRVYNNSDWIYGDKSWTNKPDYYIPQSKESKYTNCENCESCKNCCTCKNEKNDIRKSLNEFIFTKKSQNDVSPIMINVPWTEYQSGDSDPEAYNL